MSYLSNNIPLSIFCGSIFSDLLWVAWCTLILLDFVPKSSQLYTSIITQGGSILNQATILSLEKEVFQRYPEKFSKYYKTYDKLINDAIMY